jgi:putative addiction module component (TIGR02574 family)
MSLMSPATVAEILGLPTEEKLRLLEILWENLSTAPGDIPIGDAHRAAIDEALREHRRDPEDVLSIDRALAEARGE